MLPNFNQLCIPTAGTGKRKVGGDYAKTRLGKNLTDIWVNNRFRQCMLLIRSFREHWPNQSLLTEDSVEYIRMALDTALAESMTESREGDIYDLNPTVWAIWMVQHVVSVRIGSWTSDSSAQQHALSFSNLYEFLRTQHARQEEWTVYDTGRCLHRYRLPFKEMTIPPKKEDLFKYRKGALRLSTWLENAGLPPFFLGIRMMVPPELVSEPPLQSTREHTRAALWSRVAQNSRARGLNSVVGNHVDANQTRSLVREVMNESRLTDSLSDEELTEVANEMALPHVDRGGPSEIAPEDRSEFIQNSDLDGILSFLMS